MLNCRSGLFGVLLALVLAGCGTSNTGLPTNPPANDPNAPFRFYMGTLNGEDVGEISQVVREEGQEFPLTLFAPDGKKIDEFGAGTVGSSLGCCFDTSGVYKATATVEGEVYSQYVGVDASQVMPRPGPISLDQVSASIVRVSWDPVAGAELYELVLHEFGNPGGRVYETTDTFYTFFEDAFSRGTTYQVEVEAHAKAPSMELESQQLNVSSRDSERFTIP